MPADYRSLYRSGLGSGQCPEVSPASDLAAGLTPRLPLALPLDLPLDLRRDADRLRPVLDRRRPRRLAPRGGEGEQVVGGRAEGVGVRSQPHHLPATRRTEALA